MINVQTFNIVFLKTIKTLLVHLNHSTDDITKVNSAFHPSGVGKSSTGLHGCVGWQVTLCDPITAGVAT